jgi:hypothetical protein
MAKRYDVEIVRAARFVVTVEAENEIEAAFVASRHEPDWKPKSTTTDLIKVLWKDGE